MTGSTAAKRHRDELRPSALTFRPAESERRCGRLLTGSKHARARGYLSMAPAAYGAPPPPSPPTPPRHDSELVAPGFQQVTPKSVCMHSQIAMGAEHEQETELPLAQIMPMAQLCTWPEYISASKELNQHRFMIVATTRTG